MTNHRLAKAAHWVVALGVFTCSHAFGAESRPLHRFLETAPSPDGAYIADVEGDVPPSGREPTIRDLVIRSMSGGNTTTIALPCGRVRECWPASLTWTPDSRQITFTLRTPGSHARSIYSVDPDGGHLSQLLSFNGTINSLHYGADGRLAMLATDSANKEVGATQAGASMAQESTEPVHEQRIAVLKDQHLEWVSPPDMYVYEYDRIPNTDSFVGTAAPGDGDSNWWIAKLYEFETARPVPRLLYSPGNPRIQIASPRVSNDGRTVVFIGGLMSDFGSTGGDLFRVETAGGVAVNMTAGQHTSATSLGFDCHGALLVRFLHDDKSEISEIDDASSNATPRILWSGSVSMNGRTAGVSLACPSGLSSTVQEDFLHAPEIQAGSLGQWHPVTSANAGWTAPATVQSIHWKNGGFDLQGWLLLPTSAPTGSGKKLPMITEVHGGPAAANVPGFISPGSNRTLLEKGYALFLPNPRGSFGQGEAFTAANVRDFGYGDLRDILAGVKAVQRTAPIDDARLGITGGSYGGFMTMWAVTQTNVFKAAVAQAGISDWLSYYGENGIDQWMLPYFGASVYEDPKVYARSAPITFIRKVRTPTLEMVGENDIECPVPQTQEFWHALRDLHVPTSMVIYPGEGHGLRDPAHLEDAQQRELAWFGRYLQP
jgi:dipeptidyl aminopeptidase/acylaminoacyl peptidase